MFEYVVMTPPFARGSAGVRFLNQLTDDLKSIGRTAHRVYSVTTDQGLLSGIDGKNYRHHTPELLKEILNLNDEFIVIHGENQDHKHFERLNVARYYLNRIGALKKVGIPREGEFKIAWDLMFCDNPHYVLRTCTVRYPLDAAKYISLVNRQIDLTYIGKGVLKDPDLKRIPHTLELKKKWPDNDDEYFYLLKNTRHLYTYDAVSSVIDDAITLGALPVLMTRDMGAVKLAKKHTFNCVAHVDDDLDQAREDFAFMRPLYLESQQNFYAQYKRNLEECCVKMEQYFSEAV